MITITSVDVSPDMSHAKVFFTVLEKEKLQDTLDGLGRSAGFLRSQLAKRIKMYTTPELRFEYDESVERGDRLSRLIDCMMLRRKTMTSTAAPAARQAARPELERRAAEGEEALRGGEGRPCRARSIRLASGLLLVLFGEATKFAGPLLDADKEYLATLKLGERTTHRGRGRRSAAEEAGERNARTHCLRFSSGSAATSSRCRRCIRR